MIKEMYEGDTLKIDLEFCTHELAEFKDLSFIVDVGNGCYIKKSVDSKGIIELSEKDTIGLDGVYPCEIRENYKGNTKVIWQKLIKIKNSITVDETYETYKPSNAKYIEIIDRLSELESRNGIDIQAISIDEIDKLF